MTDTIKTFSQALPVLESHGVAVEALGVDEKTGKLVWKVGELEYDKAGVIALAREVAERGPAILSDQMQTYAQGYLEARKRAGHAWLDMGRFLVEARDAAKYGEWGLFLQATNTNQDQADRLMAIYTQSLSDRAFANAVRTNVLSISTAYELTSAPPDVRDRLLGGDSPPTRQQIRDEKRAANSAPARSLDTAPTLPPDFVDVQARYAARGVTLTSDIRDSRRWYTTSRPGKVGITTPTWSNVVDSLEFHERKDAQAATPAAPALLEATCRRCGETTTSYTVYGAGLVPEYPGRVVLCSSCIPKLLAERAAQQAAPVAADDTSDRAAYLAKEKADQALLDEAETEIGRGNVNWARILLGRVQVSTYRRDQLLASLPEAPHLSLPIEVQTRLVAAGASIFGDGTVLPPTGSGEAAARLSEAEAEAAIARWAKIAQTIPEVTSAPEAPEADKGVDWNVIARESYRLGATSSTAEAWIAVGNIIKLLAASDPVPSIIWLLAEADLLAPDDLAELAEQLDDAEYEALAAYRRDRSVPTLESEGINA